MALLGKDMELQDMDMVLPQDSKVLLGKGMGLLFDSKELPDKDKALPFDNTVLQDNTVLLIDMGMNYKMNNMLPC